MTYSNEYIAELLEKFMNGETSLKEERALQEYFSSAAEVPSEWREFKAMFEYFDKGMPLEPAKTKATERKDSIFMKSHRLRNILLAACMAGVAIGIGLAVLIPKRQAPDTDNSMAMDIQDSSISAPETEQPEVQIEHIHEEQASETVSTVPAKAVVTSRSVPIKTGPSVEAAPRQLDAAVQDELVRQISNQVIELAKQQVRTKMMDAVMASAGYERVLTENGTETYYNEEIPIRL